MAATSRVRVPYPCSPDCYTPHYRPVFPSAQQLYSPNTATLHRLLYTAVGILSSYSPLVYFCENGVVSQNTRLYRAQLCCLSASLQIREIFTYSSADLSTHRYCRPTQLKLLKSQPRVTQMLSALVCPAYKSRPTLLVFRRGHSRGQTRSVSSQLEG